MRYFLLCGESSGDLHGGLLMRAIRTQDPDAEFAYWGGDAMYAVDRNRLQHIEDIAFMGLVEVIKHVPTIYGLFGKAKKQIKAFQADVLILIDYPGFNLRIAKWAKTQGIPVYYYIAPKAWAWNEGRVKKIKAYVDELYCIFPFEPDYFAQWNIPAHYFGNPLKDQIDAYKADHPVQKKNGIALLPGSRKQELTYMLPIMMEYAAQHPSETFYIAQAPNCPASWYDIIRGPNAQANLTIWPKDTYSLMQQSSFALVTSGTATLEVALFDCPQIVVYITNRITYHAAKRFIKIPFISLVNIIMQKAVVKELIQNECTVAAIDAQRSKMQESAEEQQLKSDYAQLSSMLGSVDDQPVIEHIAKDMVQRLRLL